MTITAWHFTKEPDKLRTGTPFKVGEWIEVGGDLVPCEWGLHASEWAFDALQYAKGPYLWRVECEGDIIEHGDKLVCRRRRAISGGDASDLLYRFARYCAQQVITLWPATESIKRYIETGEDRAKINNEIFWVTNKSISDPVAMNAFDAALAATWLYPAIGARTAARSSIVAIAQKAQIAATWAIDPMVDDLPDEDLSADISETVAKHLTTYHRRQFQKMCESWSAA